MADTSVASDADARSRELLIELLNQIRDHTIQLLKSADSEWLLWAPAGTSNHMLWHAGHALWVLDALGVQLMTGHSELPHGWSERFGMNCRPVNETSDWPSRREIVERLTAQWNRLKELIGRIPSEHLQPSKSGQSDLVRRFVHGLHDEARHHGEMYLLFKMCHARSQR